MFWNKCFEINAFEINAFLVFYFSSKIFIYCKANKKYPIFPPSFYFQMLCKSCLLNTKFTSGRWKQWSPFFLSFFRPFWTPPLLPAVLEPLLPADHENEEKIEANKKNFLGQELTEEFFQQLRHLSSPVQHLSSSLPSFCHPLTNKSSEVSSKNRRQSGTDLKWVEKEEKSRWSMNGR